MQSIIRIYGMIILGLAIGVSLIGAPLQAQSTTARDVMETVDAVPVPEDQSLTMTMELENRQGKTLTRKLEVKKQGKNKSYLLFLEPGDVKNTAFLTITHDNRDDDMWLYLPALRKVRRISSSSKHKNFMGSDFTYDDMGDRDINDYTYEFIERETTELGHSTYLIEGTAKDPRETGYSKLKFWIRRDIHLPVKIEYYDQRGDLLKVQTNKEFEQVKDYWLATLIEMKNVQTNHATRLTMEDIKVDIGLPDMTWTERNLRR